MATSNGATHTRRNATAHRERTERSVSDRLGRKAKEVTEDLQDMGDIVKDAAQKKIGQLREDAAPYCEQGQINVQQVQRSFEEYIAQRPLKSILIAAGVGLLLGRFWMRR